MQSLPDLPTILGPIRWVLVGGIALRAYIAERLTLDIDILIHERDTVAVRDAFIAAGYTPIATLSIGGFTVERQEVAEGMPIDVLTRSDSWLDEALAHPSSDSAGYPVLGRPYLILMKLQAGRLQDLADVQRLLSRTPQSERDATRTLIAQHLPDLVADYDSLITLAGLEFGPPPQG